MSSFDDDNEKYVLTCLIVYTRLGTGWASSVLGFISVALLPVPWVFFKGGKRLRALSKYQTAENSK